MLRCSWNPVRASRKLVPVIGLATIGCGVAPGPVEIWIGGDVHLGMGRASVLSPLPSIVGHGLGIVNLEGPVWPADGNAGTLRNDTVALAQLARAGVRVAGVANNHALDFGSEGATATVRALRAAGIEPLGGGAGTVLLKATGRRIAITAHDLAAGVPEELAGDLEAARRGADLLIATFHVTGPPSYLPSGALRRAVATALQQGARVVAAHGSHSVGPVERRGDSVVAWGLGNLAFECDCTDEADAIVLQITLTATDSIVATVLPIRAGLRGGPPAPAPDPQAIFALLDALGSHGLVRQGAFATF